MKYYRIWTVLLLSIFFHLAIGCCSCSGPELIKYGNSTLDYDLNVGSELVINCTLKDNILHEQLPVDSSYLFFKKDGEPHSFADITHRVDNLTAQLRIQNAMASDSGKYHCQLNMSKLIHVCSTWVTVGYPPANVSNFRCISRNFDNLTCTWDVKPNNVSTNYSIQNVFPFPGELQDCPKANNTFCQWREDTEPYYNAIFRNLSFIVHGNNSLGYIQNEFKLDHFAIVIPNSPERLEVVSIKKQEIAIEWKPPTMQRVVDKPVLYYQIWLEELGPQPTNERILKSGGVAKLNHTFRNLIPYYKYRVSVHCRSNQTTSEDMWSPAAFFIVQTKPDIPYLVPEVHPEAFLLHNFENYRNITLYWKHVPKRYHNGENYHYYVEYYAVEPSGNINASFAVTQHPYAKIGPLQNDESYVFNIHSANKEGMSLDFKTIVIDGRNKVPLPPKEMQAISYDAGNYNLSWSKAGYTDEVNFTVFWCRSKKPALCEGPISWSDQILNKDNFSPDVGDANSTFQFAVAASDSSRSSGMQWASCIVLQKDPLGRIPITHTEPTSTTLRLIWKLDCDALKAVIDRYVITYCEPTEECEETVVEPNSQSHTLEDLHPNTNYSLKLKAFNKDNKPSEDVDFIYKSTLSGTVISSGGIGMIIIGFAVGGTLALAFVLIVAYRLLKWMTEKIHQVKNIAVKLPKELEGPESNPLSSYDSFKNGLVKITQLEEANHAPFTTDENDNKNRHGSGSSQFSNSSTDELIFKNGKCTKFGRKPSGDSSGCSSISSNTTKRVHLSSDSGTESDFVVTPSPDSGVTEHGSFTFHKQQMPILLEVHESKPHTKTDETTQLDKLNVNSDVVLKVDQPYSKFGMTGNLSPSNANSLAFCGLSLANSEPSMFEGQVPPCVMLPYSKIGLAKSSGNILGMRQKKDLSYSKFGLADHLNAGVKKMMPFVGVAMVDELANKELFLGNVLGQIPNSSVRNVKVENCHSSKPQFSGYVQVGDVRTKEADNRIKDIDDLYSSCSSLEEDDSLLQIPCDFSNLSTVWTTGVSPSNAPLDNFCLDSSIRTVSSFHQNGGQTICVDPSPSSGCLHVVEENGESDNHFNFLNTRESDRTSPVIDNQNTASPSVVLTMSPSGRNGYVPAMPNATESNSDNYNGVDQNYITPSNKGELKLLQKGSKTFSTFLHCNGSKMSQVSDPLRYILKPLPKVESEICEV